MVVDVPLRAHTPPRHEIRPFLTPSPKRLSADASHEVPVRRGCHTERPVRIWRADLSAVPSLPPAAPVFQEAEGLTKSHTSPHRREEESSSQFWPDEATLIEDSEAEDTSLPGLARSAPSTSYAASQNEYVRTVLGNVSNWSPVQNIPSLDSKSSPLHAVATPHRKEKSSLSTSATKSMTPIQRTLQDWAHDKFERPMSALSSKQSIGRSPRKPETHPTKSDVAVKALSPLPPCPVQDVHFDILSPLDKKASVQAAWESTSGKQRPSAQRVPGYRGPTGSREEPAAKRISVQSMSPPGLQEPKLGPASLSASSPNTSSPLPRLVTKEALPLHQSVSSTPSPSKAAGCWPLRPIRYASQAPAMRVWDSPEKQAEARKRMKVQKPVEVPSSPPAPKPDVFKPAPMTALRHTSEKNVPERRPRSARIAAAANVPRPKPLPTTPRTPPATHRRMPVPNSQPSLSAVDLARLTAKNTKHNQTYSVQLTLRTRRIPGPRPPSPSQKFLSGRGQRARTNFRPAMAETNEYGEPLCHAMGAGEEEEYQTPPRPSSKVRWDKRLVRSPSLQSRRPAPARPLQGCLVKVCIQCD